MDHSTMNHSMMDHSTMNHSMMDHSKMDHGDMDHSKMDHSDHIMDNGAMDHSKMDHGSMDHGGMGMHMSFYASSEATILFSFWETKSWQGMLGSCIAVFVLAALYEGLKVGREVLLRRAICRQSKYNVSVTVTDETRAMTGGQPDAVSTRTSRILSFAHFLQTLLHILQIVISYFLMLIFMTYNVWLCMAVALGAGLGYFAFSWQRAVIVDINEHCH